MRLLLQALPLGVLILTIYVGLPVGLLVAFFTSSRISRDLKLVIGTMLELGLAVVAIATLVMWGIKYSGDTATSHSLPQPVLITVRQPRLLPYPLGTGTIEQAQRDTVRQLTLTGMLPDGNTLRLRYQTRISRPFSDTL